MHPDVMRELMNQRGHELRTLARNARLARGIRRELSSCTPAGAGVARAKAAAGPVLPRIPDYVDGTFRDAELTGPGARPDEKRSGGRQAAGRRAA